MSDGGGRLIGGRYRLAERIGSGGMGTVWRAVDELVERDVAVKEPRLPGDPQDAAHQRAYNRLQREARAAARVEHPGAVAIHDVVVEDGLPWIVMELIRGESLHELLQRGALPPAESARIGLAVVGALKAAHAKGIVHRDVKPANVLLGQHGRVVLTDFGIAHIQGEESLTMSGEFVGSLEFIAPERMSGRGAGPAADLWSLGVCLYAAVEGWSPFRRTTLESTLAAILSGEPPEPKQAGPLGPLIIRLLAKDPAERPDADEVVVALEAVAEGWPVPRGDLSVPQDASMLREFADDAGTVRLGGPATSVDAPAEPRSSETPESSERRERPEPSSRSGPPESPESPESSESSKPPPARPETTTSSETTASTATATPSERPAPPEPRAPSAETRADSLPVPPKPKLKRKGRTARLVAGTLAGALLVAGGVWLGTSLTDDSATAVRGAGDKPSAASVTPTPAPTGAAADSWVAHKEEELNAVLSLPKQYVRFHEQGDADDQPRMAIYDNDEVVQVRLTQWDEAPRSPMGQAKASAEIWAGYGESKSQYTQTSFNGDEAVFVDTTYETEGRLVRVMQLMILTDDSRMYELRVDMPKGTADEERGADVFKGARDRLEIGGSRKWSPRAEVSVRP
ncbi:serine/threonine-protein kinase [Streptomyces sp. NBC_00878]|uniref:serine/threonine-protein kinase n=1 Tax=Streptomyces sp. NBC_00878 TaxID=2975854 RepID=UPI002255B0BF|nr:serine/threonine-protein kinase [Streptomyces sp. NBC_00878]MCX4906057.1 serine/threonine protein kinase [Streptomyces sp. NBC_00878]